MSAVPLFLAGLGALLAVAGWRLRGQLLGAPGALTRLYLRRLEQGDAASLGRGSSYYARLAARLLDPEDDEALEQQPDARGRGAFRGLSPEAPVAQRERLQQRLARQLERPPRGTLFALLGLQGLALLLLLAAGAWSLRSAFGLMAAQVDPFDSRFAFEIVASAAAELPLALVAYNCFCLLRFPRQVRAGAGRLLNALERGHGPAAEGPLPCRLEILSGPGQGRSLHLDRAAMTLGRVDDAGICINHRSLSRLHCRFTYAGGAFSVQDLNSANGVQVNGKEIAETRLAAGDLIELGKFKLRYLTGAPPPIEAPAPKPPPGRCPGCGRDNNPGFKWCAGCGEQLPR
jgi:FHA domain